MAIEGEVTDKFDAVICDIILPAQYFGAMGDARFCGEQRLMLAVLVDAINILQGWQRVGGARKRETFAQAAQWVNFSRPAYLFSFDNICEALDIDPGLLRERLRGLTMGHPNATRLGGGRLGLTQLSRPKHIAEPRVRRDPGRSGHVARLIGVNLSAADVAGVHVSFTDGLSEENQ
jgi:hypothetical protein